MKKKILILSGGISKERIISIDTGKQVAKELSKNDYTVKITEPDLKLIDTIKSFKCILAGDYDDLPEQAFYLVGTIEEAVEKAKTL